MNNFLRKIDDFLNKAIAVILIVAFASIAGAGLIYPRQADAGIASGSVVFDPVHTAETIINGIADYASEVAAAVWDSRNSYMDTVANLFAKQLMDYMVDGIVKWIQGGGDPKFVTDWEGFLTTVADDAGGKFLEELIGSSFMAGLCQSDWAIKINIGLTKPETFATKAKCSLSAIGANFDNFMDNFENGGWETWIKVSEGQNNPYGLYIMALNEKLDREAKATLGLEKEASASSGFLSDKVCRSVMCADSVTGKSNTMTGTYTQDDIETIQTGETDTFFCDCVQWETRTPGKIAGEALSESVFKDIKWLQNKERWQAYVVAISDAIVNRLITEGVSAITSSDSTSSSGGSSSSPTLPSDTFDTTAPVTTLSYYSSWKVQITADEPATIFYTIDGTEPNTTSLVYSDPIQVTVATTLKWFAMDTMGNTEGTHTVSLSPPFVIPDQTAPSTAIVASGSSTVALVVDKPAVIYYTTDGTMPTASSDRYLKQLDVSGYVGGIIKWFGVGSGGTEAINSMTLTSSPPFPNSELTTVSDLVAPTASITASAIAPSTSLIQDQFFKIDPSTSWDYDSTTNIIEHEWDFDNDDEYDWWTIDWNRDGVFDESQCRSGAVCTGTASGIGNGFLGMQVTIGEKAGVVEVKYSSGSRQITLQVTDGEGLSTKTSITVDVQ